VALAKALEASTVIAVDSGADKMELCRKRGADHLVDVAQLKPSSSSSMDPVVSRVLELTNGRGVDVSFGANRIGLPPVSPGSVVHSVFPHGDVHSLTVDFHRS